MFYAKNNGVYNNVEDYIAYLKGSFLMNFKLTKENLSCSEHELFLIQSVGLALLHLCLEELSKVESNKLPNTGEIKDLFIVSDTPLLDSVLDLAGYWSNDLEQAFSEKLELLESKEGSPFISERRKENVNGSQVSCFDIIYKWLLVEHKLCFNF